MIMFFQKFIYKYILKRKYFVSGKCNRCGACCTAIYVSHQKGIIKSEEEFQKLRNLHPFYTYLSVLGKDERGIVFKCNKFDEENHICKIHKFRPGICRRYPSEVILKNGAELKEGCGYSFVPIDSFKDVLKKAMKKGLS